METPEQSADGVQFVLSKKHPSQVFEHVKLCGQRVISADEQGR